MSSSCRGGSVGRFGGVINATIQRRSSGSRGAPGCGGGQPGTPAASVRRVASGPSAKVSTVRSRTIPMGCGEQKSCSIQFRPTNSQAATHGARVPPSIDRASAYTPMVHTSTTTGGNQRSTTSRSPAPAASRNHAHWAKNAGQKKRASTSSAGTPSPAIASTNPTMTYEVVNRATGSTTDGRPVLHSTSTPVAVASIGTRGRGDHNSAMHAPTAHASAAHAAGPRTFARPQPSRASRSVVAAATGSSASASSTRTGEYHRRRSGTGGAGGGAGGPGRATRASGNRLLTTSPTVDLGRSAGGIPGITTVAGSAFRLGGSDDCGCSDGPDEDEDGARPGAGVRITPVS